MSSRILHWVGGCLSRLWPAPCVLCGTLDRDGFCASCREALFGQPYPESRCRVCDRAVPFATGSRCGQCAGRAFPFVDNRSAFRYRFPVDLLVHRIKFAADLGLARQLARGWADRLGPAPPRLDAVVPVPLAGARQRARGFNQAAVLAEALARAWGVPLLQPVSRIRRTARQAMLRANARHRNLHGAFRVPEAALVIGKRLVLVDDVFTTGATAAAAAQALRDAGAALVHVRTLAHG